MCHVPSAGLAEVVTPGREFSRVETVTLGLEQSEEASRRAALGSAVGLIPVLTPAASSERGVAGTVTPASLYIGNGLSLVPGRIPEHIKRWEFIEMYVHMSSSLSCYILRGRRRGQRNA